MVQIGIVVGSTRPGRRGRLVAEWVAAEAAREHPAVGFDIVDLADFALPMLDEPQPALFGRYGNAHTVHWAQTVARFDGFVFVTPEYNHSIPAALKNALDFLYAEWNNKAAGFVGYGLHGAARAIEHLRLILAELRVATVRTQVALSLHHDFTFSDATEPGEFEPGPHQRQTLTAMLDDVVVWSRALTPVRVGTAA
ncbi:NADPH-dependent FMN reductase [Krasilnikovia sp. MM14-A1259]|uniref:NADPH-dependent FMN reductase n=1 Tax=Krasilnikovia sp. MM14-A1259 TaxID=3373539 RepID=UPI00381F4F2A